MTKEYRLFGLSEDEIYRRLQQAAVHLPGVKVHRDGEETVLWVQADDTAAQQLEDLFGVYIVSRAGESLPRRVVDLLKAQGLTLATAESCTGGLVAQQLTAVPGCSQVFGTGVVSYSCACKQSLLGVREETLTACGAVSAATAGEMARGVRRQSGAALGVSVTGEAGPVPAEAQPVGTVFIALADAKRTWVKELHIDAPGREAIRRAAAGHVLDLVRRYLEAYPAVMAGGQLHRAASYKREIPRTTGPRMKRLLARLLPWQGDSPRRLLLKSVAWVSALTLVVGSMLAGYRYLLAPGNNQELQESLGDIYWGHDEDLTEDTPAGAYPAGMMTQFRGLYDRNSDVRGWIRIPDTAIDFPVMTYRGGYYQNHSFLDQYSVYGQPYFGEDTVISPLAADRTMTIYGKNTGGGQMFSDLLSYRRIAYLREHPLMEMNTLYATGRWEIFAVLVADERNKKELDYARTTFADEADYVAYLKDLQRRSLFLTDSTVTAKDRVLLLSTDAQQVYGFSGARLVIAARLLTGESTVTYRANNRVRYPAAMSGPVHTTQPTTTTVATEATAVSTTATSAAVTTVTTLTIADETTATTEVPTTANTDVTVAVTTATTPTTAAGTTTATEGAEDGLTTTTTHREVPTHADIGD